MMRSLRALAGGAVVVATLFATGSPGGAAAPRPATASGPASIFAHTSGTGAITGTVTASSGGTSSPVSGACVSAETTGGTVVASTTSASDGTYSLSTVAAGSYVVAFTACTSGNYVPQYYNGTPTGAAQISGATVVSVTASATASGIDAVMVLGGTISGTVTDASGSGLAGICVSAIASGEPSLGSTPTTSSGAYTIAGVPAGSYAIEFYGCATSANYIPQYYNGTPTGAAQISGATAVTVTASATTSGIDAVMVLGGTISGTVTDASGAGVAGVCVTVSTAAGVAGTALSGSTGTYAVSGLQTGSYTVLFSGCTSATSSDVAQYFDGASGGASTPAAASSVSVTAGATTSGIGAVMAVGGTISGTVTAGGSVVSGECVSVDSLAAGLGGSATTASDGTYAVTGLAAGSYVVEFIDCASQGYADQYYNGTTGGTPSYQSALAITVTAGSTTTVGATLVAGGSIAGTVDNSSGVAVAGICVLAATADGSSVGQAQTSATGTYAITGLTAGSYVVSFSDCGGAGNYASQYYNGTTGGAATYGLATAVSVAAGAATSSIDAVMAAGGAISGTVTAAGSGLAGICVDAFATDGALGANAVTGSTGTYLLAGLAAGSYTVEFTDCNTPATYATAYYGGANLVDTLAQAPAVPVTAGATTSGIDGAMTAGGTIAGTVTDATSAQAESGICVSAYGVSVGVGASAVSASDGTYTLSGLPPGLYVVSFSPCAPGSPYASQFYDGSPGGTTSWGFATPLTVTSGGTIPGIDAQMEPGGSITGTVTDASGNPVAGVCAQAQSASSWSAPVPSSPSGTYRISGLSGGTYSVYFFDCGTLVDYAAQYYTGTPGGSPSSAVPITVTPGATTSGIDAVMAEGGSISGTVTDAQSAATLADICVSAYEYGGQGMATTVTLANGSYDISGLASGGYVIQFAECGNAVGATSYVGQFYDGVSGGSPTYGGATVVNVTAGTTTSGIDAAMVIGGDLTGTVSDTSGAGIGEICVVALTPQGQWVATGMTLSDGTYDVTGLPTGSYMVQFEECGNLGTGLSYIAQYYSGQATAATATLVSVTAGSVTASVNATLTLGGTISGSVTSAVTSSGAPGLCVVGLTPQGQWVASATTQPDGSYNLAGLPSGSYVVEFETCGLAAGPGYVTQFYDGSTTFSGATAVSVSAGAITSGISAALQPGGAMSGVVTDAAGTAVSGVCAAISTTGGQFIVGQGVGANGTWAVGGLAAGTYDVSFQDCGPTSGTGYLTQYYDGSSTQSGATPVTVTAGQTSTGIDATLQPGGAISGTVSVSGGSGLGGICVNAMTPGGQFVTGTQSATNGTYTLAGLPTGSYDVSFQSCGLASGTGYVTQFYNGSATFSNATPVSVTAGQTSSGIDATLQVAGAISGTVSVSGGTGLGGICVNALTSSGQFVSGTVSVNGGTYTLSGLASGGYVVEFVSCGTTATGTGYLTQYYNGSSTLSGGATVTVTAGSTTTGIGATMQPGGAISGTVSDSSSTGIGGICVSAMTSATNYVTTTLSASNGSYNLSGLPAGSYDVSFQSCGSSSGGTGYLTQYYNGSSTFSGATAVSVTAGQTSSGIDATLESAAAISGTLTDSNGALASGVCVTARNTADSLMYTVASGANGTYNDSALPPGQYTVEFSTCGNDTSGPYYVTQYYNGMATLTSATVVTLTAGTTATGTDAVLQLGGAISGTVTDSSGTGIGGICVSATPSSGTGTVATLDQSSGTYDLLGLSAGSYTITFQECDGGTTYATQYFSGATTSGSATPVTVTTGSMTSNVNATMLLAQSVSFTSTAPTSPAVGSTYTPTATASSGLTVTFSIDATSTSGACSISSGVVTFLAAGTCVIDAVQAGSATYAPAEAQQTVTIGGTVVAAVRAPLPGRPGSTRGSGPSAHGSQTQTVAFTSSPPATPTVGESYTPTATASSGLTVTFSIDGASTPGACAVSAGSVSFTAAGTCVIDATQAGNVTYASASAQQTVTVGAGNQTVTFTSSPPATPTVGASYTPTATASSGLTVTFTIDGASTPGACTLGGGVVTFTGTGACVVDATQVGNANYLAAPTQSQTLSVSRGTQTLVFASTPPSPIAPGLTTYTPALVTSSGLPATLSVDAASTPGSCVVVGPTVSFEAPGTCVLDATQAGNALYLAAPEAQQSVSIPVPAGSPPSGPVPPIATPPVAVPPPTIPGLPSSAFGAPASIDVGSTSTQVSITLAGGIVVTVVAPPGALPAGTALSLYDVATSGLGSFVPAGANALGGVAISWQVPAGSTPGSTVTLQVTAHGGGLAAGDLLGSVVSGTWSLMATLSGPGAAVPISGDQVLAFASPAPAPALTVGASHGWVGRPLSLTTSGGTTGMAVSFRLLGPGSASCQLAGSQVRAARAGTCRVVATQVGSAGAGAQSTPVTLVFRGAPSAGPLVRAVRGALAPRGAVSRIMVLGRGFAGRPVIRVPGAVVGVRVVSDSGTSLILTVRQLRAVVGPRVRLILIFAHRRPLVITVPVR